VIIQSSSPQRHRGHGGFTETTPELSQAHADRAALASFELAVDERDSG